jgi:hypothetical protein
VIVEGICDKNQGLVIRIQLQCLGPRLTVRTRAQCSGAILRVSVQVTKIRLSDQVLGAGHNSEEEFSWISTLGEANFGP